MVVICIDSDCVVVFGIGRFSSNDDFVGVLFLNCSFKKKVSIISQLFVKSDIDDEYGIFEIGIQVFMFKYVGDVQVFLFVFFIVEKKYYSCWLFSCGNLFFGSYGLYGYGVGFQDKFDKVYFEKYFEFFKKEYVFYYYDCVKDFFMSSEELNKIVCEIIICGFGFGVKNYFGIFIDQVVW